MFNFYFNFYFFAWQEKNEFSSFTQSRIELFTHGEMMPSLIRHPFLANILIDFAMHHWQGMLLRALQLCRFAKNITTFWLTCPLCSHRSTDTHNAVINRCLSLTFWAPLTPWALFFFSSRTCHWNLISYEEWPEIQNYSESSADVGTLRHWFVVIW